MNILRSTEKHRFNFNERDKLESVLTEHLHLKDFDFLTVNKVYHGSLDPHYEVVLGKVFDLSCAMRKSEQRRA